MFDARYLTKEMKFDSNKWFGHVEKPMLLLSKKDVATKALRLLPLRRAGQLRQRDSKSLWPLRADRAYAIARERDGMVEYCLLKQINISSFHASRL